jgi:hypothetical protein
MSAAIAARDVRHPRELDVDDRRGRMLLHPRPQTLDLLRVRDGETAATVRSSRIWCDSWVTAKT